MSWDEIVAYLASEFGYNLNRRSDWFLGHLKMSQVNHLIHGMNSMKRKESGSSDPKRHQVSSISEMKNIPGFKVKPRKKN